MTNSKGRNQNRKRRNREIRNSRSNVTKSLVEYKFYDYYFANTNEYLLPLFTSATYVDDAFEQDTTGAGAGYVCINQIVQGLLGSTRIGNKYQIMNMNFKMSLKLVGTNKYNSARVLIVRDQFPNGAAPILSDILLSFGIGTALNFQSFVNPYHTERVKVLHDNVFDIDSDFKDQINVKFSVKKKINVQCQASNGNIADISHGAVYLIAGSQEYAGAAGVTTSINCKLVSARIKYRDI